MTYRTSLPRRGANDASLKKRSAGTFSGSGSLDIGGSMGPGGSVSVGLWIRSADPDYPPSRSVSFTVGGSVGAGGDKGGRGSCRIEASARNIPPDAEPRIAACCLSIGALESGPVVDTAPTAAKIARGSDSQFHSAIVAVMSGLA
jgi:hypothetical protein